MLYFSIKEEMDLKKITNSLVSLIRNHIEKNEIDGSFLTIDIKKVSHTIEKEKNKNES